MTARPRAPENNEISGALAGPGVFVDPLARQRIVNIDDVNDARGHRNALAIEMIRVARPGVPEALLYARVMRRMLELGSEYYPWAIEVGPIGTELTWYENPPMDVRLQADDLIMNETDAVL